MNEKCYSGVNIKLTSAHSRIASTLNEALQELTAVVGLVDDYI